MKSLFKKKQEPSAIAVQTRNSFYSFPSLRDYIPQNFGELQLYDQLRQMVPIIDAAIDKILRLMGSFQVHCSDADKEAPLQNFLQTVQVNATSCGLERFLLEYLDQLLTYGNAVGEIVLQNGQIAALYNASLRDVELVAKTPLSLEVRRRTLSGSEPVPYPELVMVTALNPPPGSAKGVSLLRSLPFVTGILLQIFHTLGVNWERIGNVRFAVTCEPGRDGEPFAKERAEQMATQWKRAMTSREPSDFVAVGNVHIQAIGADNQILDSEIPVRQMLEQIVAKLGIPPFLLGLSWSSTERMSSQQADLLTSELESYRRLLEPIIRKICTLWLRLSGSFGTVSIDWDDISLQDTTELANAAHVRAQTSLLEEQIRKLKKENANA